MSDLVAPRVDSTTWHSGIWIAEDIDALISGITSGDWIDIAIGGFAVSMDALAFVTDPLGQLVAWGVGWLIEHLKPLSDALDALAGDPDQITANAQTWLNIAGAVGGAGTSLGGAVTRQLGDWTGRASDTYRHHADEHGAAMAAMARAATAMAEITRAAGLLVAMVRSLVRDLIAEFVSVLAVRLWEWAAELGLTLGAAAPLVVTQVTALAAKWAARITRLLRGLVTSLRRLAPVMRRLGELIDSIREILRRLGRRGGGAGTPNGGPPPPVRDPRVEAERLRKLGEDPATGAFRQAEMETAQRVEQRLGIELQRSSNPNVDWVDANGKTYDAVGNFDGRFFDRQWPNLQTRIMDHLAKADFVPVDVSRFTPAQIAQVRAFIAPLGPRVFIVGD